MSGRGLSARLSQQLRATLLNCGPFASANELQAVFSDARISPWRHQLPEANTAAGRVTGAVDFLYRRQSNAAENALVLFLRVLGERTPEGDSCHARLFALADAVAATVEEDGHARVMEPVDSELSDDGAISVEIPIELREQMAAGEVGLFVGHRLAERAGLPGRVQLVKALAERLDEGLSPDAYDDGAALPDVAQLYEVARGRHALLSYLRDRLDTTLLQPAAVHGAIARLPVHTIFTTGYDDLLERALRATGRRVNKVTADAMLHHAGADRVQLLKLKGEIEMPETVVVTRQDLDQYAANHPLIVNQLRDRLSSTTFLLLGYDADDPDLKLLFEQSGYQAGSGRLHYAAMTGVAPLQKQVLRSRRIRVIDVAADGLAEWLGALAGYA